MALRPLSNAKKTRALQALAQGLTIAEAAESAGCERTALWRLRQRDPEFAAAWEEAYEAGADVLEAEAKRRAVDGVEKPVTVAGERELVREYSDTLLIFLLKGRRPDKFARFEVTGKAGGPIQHEHEHRGVSLDDILRVASASGAESDRPENTDA